MMAKKDVLHINYVDENGEVYCRKAKKVVHFDEEFQSSHCSKCPFFAGSAQGEGVECEWKDPREELGSFTPVTNAQKEVTDLAKYEKSLDLEDKAFIEKLASRINKSKEEVQKEVEKVFEEDETKDI